MKKLGATILLHNHKLFSFEIGKDRWTTNIPTTTKGGVYENTDLEFIKKLIGKTKEKQDELQTS